MAAGASQVHPGGPPPPQAPRRASADMWVPGGEAAHAAQASSVMADAHNLGGPSRQASGALGPVPQTHARASSLDGLLGLMRAGSRGAPAHPPVLPYPPAPTQEAAGVAGRSPEGAAGGAGYRIPGPSRQHSDPEPFASPYGNALEAGRMPGGAAAQGPPPQAVWQGSPGRDAQGRPQGATSGEEHAVARAGSGAVPRLPTIMSGGEALVPQTDPWEPSPEFHRPAGPRGPGRISPTDSMSSSNIDLYVSDALRDEDARRRLPPNPVAPQAGVVPGRGAPASPVVRGVPGPGGQAAPQAGHWELDSAECGGVRARPDLQGLYAQQLDDFGMVRGNTVLRSTLYSDHRNWTCEFASLQELHRSLHESHRRDSFFTSLQI